MPTGVYADDPLPDPTAVALMASVRALESYAIELRAKLISAQQEVGQLKDKCGDRCQEAKPPEGAK